MSGVLWTSEEASKATDGVAMGRWEVTGLSIDSRSLKAGELFIPLKDVRDGHEFIPSAREAGAGAVISERNIEAAPALIVDDSLAAMRDMAVAARQRSKAKRIAITGSVGKTSLKEAISAICQSVGRTHKSQKSFNNHWGVPLTLASMPKDTEFGVFEAGMNHAGELADLSPLIAPHVAVITKIAPAHLAHFENIDAIAEAKSEIFQGLDRGRIAVLNRDDNYYEFLKKKAKASGAQIVTFGQDRNADVRFKAKGIIEIGGRSYRLSLKVDGSHWVQNAACAIAATMSIGISPETAMTALAEFGALPGRGEVLNLRLNGTSFTMIDDSYNANPESMRAAIHTLGARKQGRKIAILGDMFELGKDEEKLHADLAKPLRKAGVGSVICLGQRMQALRDALPADMFGFCVEDWEAALAALRQEIRDGDIVLVKGSNATGLGKLVAAIKQEQNGVADVL